MAEAEGFKMRTIFRWIKKQFGIYDPGHEYWIPLKDIIITPDFARTRIGKSKWRWKKRYYYRTGKFESPIILDKNFTLRDGYSSYRIAKYVGLDKVPVYFEEYMDEDK